MIPDFRNFVGTNQILVHSAKGSTWEDHKYVKKIDGVYYYPVGYEDGRTIDDLKGGKDSKDKDEKKEKTDSKSKEEQIKEVKQNFDQYLAKRGIDWRTLPKDEVDQMQRDIVKQLESGKETGTKEKSTEELAKDAVVGKLGSGEDRKLLLGDRYAEVQKQINEIMKNAKINESIDKTELTEEEKKKTSSAAKKVSGTKIHSGVNMEKVMSVYKKKKK